MRRLTVEGVAARAGVAKTTIYRHWRSKDELALAVLIDMVEQVVAVPDLDDTRAELVAFVEGAVRILGSTLMGRVMQGLVSDLAADPELARAFRERVVAARIAEVRRLLERGIERGDLRPDTDRELADELLFGPIRPSPAAQRRAARARARRTRRRRRATRVRRRPRAR